MLEIKNYVRVQSLAEAYELCQNRSNVIIGGMLWLKMQNRSVDTAIDLCDLKLRIKVMRFISVQWYRCVN